MNKYIKKPSFFLLALLFALVSCNTEESLIITSPDPAFTLQQPGISSVFLNFGLPTNNAFTVSWNDEVTGSSSYTVEMSLDDAFTAPITLGTVNTNSFSITVEDLNTAIRSAGVTTFRDIAVYLRVNAGSINSNTVLYLVTTYPIENPQITSPSENDAFVLTLATSGEFATNIEFSDAVLSSTLGIEVNYTIEASIAGSNFADPVIVGALTNKTLMALNQSDLNAVALGAGLPFDVAGDLAIRIIARITNENGDILERISDVVTISVTPYNVSFPYLFLVGDATTPGWNNNNNNPPIFRDQDVPNAYFFTGYFGAGAFKLLETLGQWQPQWGTNDGSTLAVNPGGGSDPGTFNVASAGYYKYTFTTVGESGSFTVEPYDASGAATYPTIGLIGDATPGGWGTDTDFTQDPNNPHLWYLNGITLTSGGSMLIRADNTWDNVWRYTGSSELYGTAVLAGGGDNIPFNEPTGSYDVWFNDLDGGYVIIPN
ncbi:SusE domain-containing protein [Gaetbulibacter sp. M235]|uniref:SusE domain-containing protein n=1 Tax=Gaetbulibacter sp. M235 TaxID=3126510 RepID=UPI00374E787F